MTSVRVLGFRCDTCGTSSEPGDTVFLYEKDGPPRGTTVPFQTDAVHLRHEIACRDCQREGRLGRILWETEPCQ